MSLKTELACPEHSYQKKKSAVSPPRLITAVCTPSLSYAVSDEIFHPCLQGSMHLHAAPLPSSSAIH